MKADTLIFDGKHLLWRCADAFNTLSYEVEGEEIGTGAIYGWLSCAMRVRMRYGGRAIVAWEGSNNFRYKLYPEYKAKDEPDEEKRLFLEDMKKQEKRLKAVLRAIGMPQFLANGGEADDVIGTLAARHEMAHRRVVIYSGDSDLRQLVTSKISVVSPGFKGKETMYGDSAAVKEKHGVDPMLIPDLKALAGDNSDNIPGMPGIGDKRAVQAIQECGDIDEIITAAKSGKPIGIPERFRAVLIDNEESLRLYKRLTTINLGVGMDAIKPKRSRKRVAQYFMAYGFRSLMEAPEMEAVMALGDEDDED